MTKRFRTYDLAVAFYRGTRAVRLPSYVKNQFDRASLSIALNLSEGRGRKTKADQTKFFHIALGSVRECQSILELHTNAFPKDQVYLLDRLAASVYLLTKRAR